MSFAFARPPLIQSVKKTTLHLCSHTGAYLLVPLVWGCAGVQQHSGAADPPGGGVRGHTAPLGFSQVPEMAKTALRAR